MNRSSGMISLLRETRYYQPKINVVNGTEVEQDFLNIFLKYGGRIRHVENWLLYKVMPMFINNEEDLLRRVDSREELTKIAKLRSPAANWVMKGEKPLYVYVRNKETVDYFARLIETVVALVKFYKENPDKANEQPSMGFGELYSQVYEQRRIWMIRRGDINTEPYFNDEKVVYFIKSAHTIVNKAVCLDLIGSKKLLLEGKTIPEPYGLLSDTVLDQYDSVSTLIRKSGSYTVKRESLHVNVVMNYDGATGPTESFFYISPKNFLWSDGPYIIHPMGQPIIFKPNNGKGLPYPIYNYGQLLSTCLFDWDQA